MHRLRLLFFLLSGSFLLVAPGHAQQGGSVSTAPSREVVEPRHILDEVDWVVDLGAFYAQVDSNVRVDGKGPLDVGTGIDFESDLGLAEQELLFNAQIIYQGWEKWSLGVEWFQLDRNATGAAKREIDWGDTTIPVGATVDSYFDVDIFRVFGGYEIWRNSSSVVGLGLGVHGADMGVGITGNFTAGGNRVDFDEEAGTGSIIPLPNFGVWGSHAFSDKLYGSLRLDGFALEIDDYRGVLWNVEANLRYKATEQLSLGAGYSYFFLEVDMDRKLWRGEAKFSYHGPKAFIFYAW